MITLLLLLVLLAVSVPLVRYIDGQRRRETAQPVPRPINETEVQIFAEELEWCDDVVGAIEEERQQQTGESP